MDWRYFDPETDQESATQLWHDVGWINGHDAQARRGMEAYATSGRGYVALVHDNPACFVFESRGHLQYLGEELTLSAITGVATDRTGRKQGLASRLTEVALVEAASAGVALAGLSTFEQGFYDKLGFGTGAYEHLFRFDPARLTVNDKVRPPHHLGLDQIEALHASRCARKRFHGNVTLTHSGQTTSTMFRSDSGFGLGYFDEGGETPSHCLWCSAHAPGTGPYSIQFMAWKTTAQFLELMGLIKQWGDQVRLVVMIEPAGIQLQDFMDRPTQHFNSTAGGKMASGCHARANFQYRILDLAACIAATRLTGSPLAFNLVLSDPMSTRIENDEVLSALSSWRGLGGSYRIQLGKTSQLLPDTDPVLPTLTASVGAFTRLWMGVCPATGLAVSDDLRAPESLLEGLDATLALPSPVTNWDY